MLEGRLPPTEKGKVYELKALAIRDFAGLDKIDAPLDPFKLAKYAGLAVVSFEEIKSFLSEKTLKQLLDADKDSWSGGVCSKPLPDGRRLIILNPTHGKNRQRATLMEEICHVFLGHRPSKIVLNSKKEEKLREYRREIEEEAYSVGAAALVPYQALYQMVMDGMSAGSIAKHFRVSRKLVEYRIKVTKLWQLYLQNQELSRENQQSMHSKSTEES